MPLESDVPDWISNTFIGCDGMPCAVETFCGVCETLGYCRDEPATVPSCARKVFPRNPCYHGPQDTPETLDYARIDQLTDSLASMCVEVDNYEGL